MRLLALALLIPLTACNVRLTEDGGVSVAPARDEEPPVTSQSNSVVTTEELDVDQQEYSPTPRRSLLPNQFNNVVVNVNREDVIVEGVVWEKARTTAEVFLRDDDGKKIVRIYQGEEVHRISIRYAASEGSDRFWYVSHPRTGERGWISEDNVTLVVR